MGHTVAHRWMARSTALEFGEIRGPVNAVETLLQHRLLLLRKQSHQLLATCQCCHCFGRRRLLGL